MMFIPNSRTHFLLGFLFCVVLLVAAYFFQFAQGLEPCPLCISQRLGVFLVGLVMLMGWLHPTGAQGTRRYALAGTLAALLGASVSIRHLWIQHLPPEEVPACGPGLSYMLQYFAFTDTLKAMVTGTGDCAKVEWTFLGFSMPFWVLMSFLLLAAWSSLRAFYPQSNQRF